jgi:tRNA A-37 threonylcarbamoyl transferase component Bud32
MDSLKPLHKSGIVHGDARLENVVCVDARPVWIDFADSIFSPAMERTKREELETLKACISKKFNGYNAC